jgi:hypothetical protein
VSRLTRLGSLERRLQGKTDDELAAGLKQLREELREFRREHRQFRDRAHAAVDETLVEARKAAEQILARELSSVQAPAPVEVYASRPAPPAARAAWLLALCRPEFAKAWHQAVDHFDGFSPLTMPEFEAELAERERAIQEHVVELERRRIAAARDVANAELAHLESQL